MFTQSCYIEKNTLELRNKLKELGYKYGGKERTYGEAKALYCHFDRFYECVQKPSRYESIVNCKDNEELFLALAALRDDSDYMQWFVSPKTHTKRLSGCFGQLVGMDGHYQEIVGYDWYRYENKDNALTERLNAVIQMEVEDMEFLPYKATVKELIEHFNMRKNEE